MAGCQLRVTSVTADDVFNLPLYEYHLVMDTRPRAEYEQGHIATASSLPAPEVNCTEAERERLLLTFLINLVSDGMQPEMASPVLLYGNGSGTTEAFNSWLAGRLEALKGNRPLDIATLHSSEPPTGQGVVETEYDPLRELSDRLTKYTEEVWILEGGYQSFLACYGFLCGNVSFADLTPVPHRITDCIFMGSRPLKTLLSSDMTILKQLGITHLILDNEQRLASEQDIVILRCDVPDANDVDMGSCFDAAVLCMSEVVAVGQRVLVQLHGRSRSASLIIAWLMAHRQLTLDLAAKVITDRCWKRIDMSLIYAEQLQARQLPPSILPGEA